MESPKLVVELVSLIFRATAVTTPICGKSWVLQRIGRLAEAMADAEKSLDLGKPVNVTHRPGYDNQPCFLADSQTLLYTSAEPEGGTDIYRFSLATKTSVRVTRTPESEYSPTPLESGGFCTVRVEADSTQRLWRFDQDGTNPQLVMSDGSDRLFFLDPKTQAFLYGPLVLAGDLGSEGLTEQLTVGPNAPRMRGMPLETVAVGREKEAAPALLKLIEGH
jgi:hypothetical protein